MKNYLRLSVMIIGLCVFSSDGVAGEGILLLDRKPVDLAKASFYSGLTEERDGLTVWKKQYVDLDSIQMDWISYLSDGLKLTGLLIKPKEKGLYPCIIYNRGNRVNSEGLTVSDAFNLAQFAAKGYIVIAGNYRKEEESEIKGDYAQVDVRDVLNLINVLKEVEGVDNNRIGMYGWGRGGMITYLALSETDKISAAAAGGAGVEHPKVKAPETETELPSQIVPDYPAYREEKSGKNFNFLQIDRFPGNVPILMLHGNGDNLVDSGYSIRLALLFDKHRIPYRLKIFEGGDHYLTEQRAEVNHEVLNWFNRFLKNNEALPDMEYHGY